MSPLQVTSGAQFERPKPCCRRQGPRRPRPEGYPLRVGLKRRLIGNAPPSHRLTDNSETHNPTVAADVDTVRELHLVSIAGEVVRVAVLVDWEGVLGA